LLSKEIPQKKSPADLFRQAGFPIQIFLSLVEPLHILMLIHVPEPDKESSESDHDQQLIPPGRNRIHDSKNKLKESGNCIPETRPHNSLFYCWRKNRKIRK
jgi:hypothetical protein